MSKTGQHIRAISDKELAAVLTDHVMALRRLTAFMWRQQTWNKAIMLWLLLLTAWTTLPIGWWWDVVNFFAAWW